MKSLYKALAAFQQEVPVIHKGTTGYGYSYASLPEIFEVINPILKKHGLGFTQPMDGTSLKTIVFHIESGEFIEGCAEIPQGVALSKMNDFQVLGSAITYFRRYQLAAMLGLITDVDNDAAGDQVKKAAEPPKTTYANVYENTVKAIKSAKNTKELEAARTTASLLKKDMTDEQRQELNDLYLAKQDSFK